MPEFTLTLVLRIALGLVLALALFNVVRNVRRSRTAPYFILRRAAAGRFLRWLAVLLVAGLALGLSFVVRLPPLVALLPARQPTPTATPPPTATPQPPVEAEVPPETPSPEATDGGPTPLPAPTLTPSPMFATRESSVTPQLEASITITAVSTELGEDFLPVNPGTVFPAGVTRFYVFYDYAGMSEGVSWSGVVLVNGLLADDVSFDELWQTGEEGTGLYRWFDRDDGWPAGNYEVQFYIGDQRTDSVTFELVGGS